MKNKFFSGLLLLLVLAIFSLIGFKTWNKTDCCQEKEYPYEMHSSAMRLMQACQDLVITDGAVCHYHAPKIDHVTTSVMSASGYANGGKPGVVSFTLAYYQDSAIFRTSWQPGNFESYPDNGCAPNPNIFPFPGVGANNHYEFGLIPVADYQAAPVDYKKFTVFRKGPNGEGGSTHVLGVIKTDSITAIENIRLEPATGYIKTHEPALYNNERSSKGFVCDVSIKGKTGKTPCYIINNYDGDGGTLRWKVKKECP